MNLKLDYIKDRLKQFEVDYIDNVKQLGEHSIKISTNNLKYVLDRKDERLISAIKNLKLIYKLDKGCLILRGTIECEFKEGFCGKFFCTDAIKDESVDFDAIRGVEAEIDFSKPLCAIKNDELKEILSEWVNNPNLVYNLKQFVEFMELFKFYKALSTELNNEQSFKIEKIGKPYFFVSSEDSKEFEHKGSEVFNSDDILIGYKMCQEDYDQLSNEDKYKVNRHVDVELKGDGNTHRSILRAGNGNIFLSNCEKITERDVTPMVDYHLVSLSNRGGKLILSGVPQNNEAMSYEYLNLYDMGQKIKVESIENSLKLIKQGATGGASELLGYLIGDEKMPDNASSTDETKEKYMMGLNESQRKAFLMATDGSSISLIKGPPGTGKTHVINAIVQYIVKELNEKVVISSQTHVAIDNVLDKLMSNQEPIIPKRISRSDRKNKYDKANIDVTLYETWGKQFSEHVKRASNTDLANKVLSLMTKFKGHKRFVYSLDTNSSDYAVTGATTTTSAISGKKGLEEFDGYKWLIIDEVSKCPITEVLRYLPYIEKIILVGDDYQLAPLLEFRESDVKDFKSFDKDKFDRLKAMYENSVFAKTLEKARESNRLVILNENYRSTEHVLAAYNVFYDNTLIGKRNSQPSVHFKSRILNDNNDIFFVEVLHGKEVKDKNKNDSRYNIEELNATKLILEEVRKSIANPERVSVAAIFPYGAQIERFQRENKKLINDAKRKFKSFEIDTVDAFQGKEADVVLCNTVVADISQVNHNFLTDFRRINVAMSRAKDKLIVFGNSTVLSQIEMGVNSGHKRRFFRDIIEHIRCNGKVIVYDGGELRDEKNRSKSTLNFA